MRLRWLKKVSVHGWDLKAIMEQIFDSIESIFPPQTRLKYGLEKTFVDVAEYDLENNIQTVMDFEEVKKDQFEHRINDLKERGWKIIEEESKLPTVC